MLYLNNVCIKRLKKHYSNCKVELGVRQFVAKYLLNINKVLTDIKRAGATILGYKSNFCYPSIIVVSY